MENNDFLIGPQCDEASRYEPTPADWAEYGAWCDEQDRMMQTTMDEEREAAA